MGFSAIIPAADVAAANAALGAAGYGASNFSVPLWRGAVPDVDSYGMNVGGAVPDFQTAVEAIPGVSVRITNPGAVEFDEHAASLGLSREPPAAPTTRRKGKTK